MNRYPDQIIILEPIGGTPYDNPTWRQVYTGRCRCFLDRQAAFRTNKIMDCTYQVVIPDRNMPEIGENHKVGIKMHTNKSNRNWDLVGYVKDFARYDRVCNLYFQMVKENIIYEDVPEPAINPDERTLNTYDDEWFHMESVGLVEGNIMMEDDVLTMEFLKSYDGENMYHPEFYSQNQQGEWIDIHDTKVFTNYTNIEGNYVYVIVPTCRTYGLPEKKIIRVEIWTGPGKESRGELVDVREIAIMPKGE